MSKISEILSSLSNENRLRRIPNETGDGMLDLSSNDYLSLGLRCDEFREEFLDRFSDAAFSSSASRLLSVRQRHHNNLEEYLSTLYGKPALLFNSGYHANVGCVGALSLPSSLFICDKLIHASVVDGLRMAGSEFKRFPHNDTKKLRMILERECGKHDRTIVIVESIYSMDGDLAPLQELITIKKEYPEVLLYVDEAHAFGVRGPRGLGLTEELDIINDIDLIIGTFGKAAASAGAFAVCSEDLKSLLINTARPFIFSTAIPPVNVAWTHLMVEKITGMETERKNLAQISRFFSENIECISGTLTGSESQIIPYITGDAAKAISVAAALREKGIIALPIRRPTVPPGGERIRFSLGATMTEEILRPVLDLLENLRNEI
ncbi:MAG: aminotransferase class I/II-fold pyridoxal phosphate-dependent enzyme [Muribaculaceae bacterium]|nr:aminotransferase class I/II-fold pyridoxal phosphate-dependent enzyme [Muribaculaceae bacterium]